MAYRINDQGHVISEESGAVVDETRLIHCVANGRGRAALVTAARMQIPPEALSKIAKQQNVSVEALVNQIIQKPSA